ncbi:ANR family transcriptional regulator [Histophilus somni]|uniref:ANR family transcriptional regulator n=1 Tax=Histophilus somni TaxID=731 RepID=UPI0011C2563D|nr:ANR family transcriptional regulator [Histophilus somni]QEH13152.1 ANR family transcriptional regulator [Histophilus somni]
MINHIIQFDRFKHYSQQAANLERQAQWAEAAKAWEVAAINARPRNKHWCESRQAFCRKQAEETKKGKWRPQ